MADIQFKWSRIAIALSIAVISYRVLTLFWLLFIYLFVSLGIVGLWYANLASLFVWGGFLGFPDTIGKFEFYMMLAKSLNSLSSLLIGWWAFRWSKRYDGKKTWSYYLILILGLLFLYIRTSINPVWPE